jgi:hypothetical protein
MVILTSTVVPLAIIHEAVTTIIFSKSNTSVEIFIFNNFPMSTMKQVINDLIVIIWWLLSNGAQAW